MQPNLPSPPSWADRFLRILLGHHNADVSGDLLEEYRAHVHPTRGQNKADAWFVQQVIEIAWRAIGWWAVAFAALQLGRDLFDWLMPPADYRMRSMVTTYAAASLFVALGFWRGWRTRSIRSTALAALSTALVAATFKVFGVLLFVWIWDSAQIGSAIKSSGGFDESIALPWMITAPATILAIAGGLVGKIAAHISRPKATTAT